MSRDDWAVIVAAFAAATFLLLCAVAFAEGQPDCAVIRAKIAEHGKLAVYAWALANGYSPKEIARVRKVCGV